MFKIFKKQKILFAILFIFAFLPILALFHTGFPITHDGQDHVARIANFYQNLTEGNLIPRWAANLNWGFGHPILEFLYPLPSYIASFFHFVGFSLIDSTKIVFGAGMVLSLYFMYLWLCQFSSKYAAVFGAVLYTYAPYRFVELYVRGDIGENLAFAFIPLALFFIYKLHRESNYKFAIFGGISLALLILSHNAISLMLMPFILLYGLFFVYLSTNRKSYIVNFVSLILIGFALSAFFWVPALIEGKYTLRNIVTKGTYLQSFVLFKNLIYGPWSYGGSGQFSVQFGLFQWIALIAAPFLIFKEKAKKNRDYIFISLLLIYTLSAIFLMLSQSNFIWSHILLLQSFQFPWRFLAIIVFTTAVLGTFAFEWVAQRISPKALITICILIILAISSFYWFPKAYQYKSENFYSGIYESTTDTGESAPIWSIRFMEHRPKAQLEVLDGKAEVKSLERQTTYHKYEVTVEKKTLFAENTLYFPGWEIKANRNPVKIEFQNMQYRGVMLFFLDKGNYKVEAVYKETKLREIADLISFLSLVVVAILLLVPLAKIRAR